MIRAWTTWESHLTQRAAAGDPVAFDIICDTYRGRLANLANRMLWNGEDAGDAVQETYLRAFRALARFDCNRPLWPWLSRICANCCVDIQRDRTRHGLNCDSENDNFPDIRDMADRAETKLQSDLLREAIDRLPTKYRQIIEMRHFQHMEVNEIAGALKRPEGTVKSWLFRARALLRKQLSPAILSI